MLDSASGNDICDRTATELTALVRSGEMSARELLDAHLARIELTNPTINAIVTLATDQAAAWATDADRRHARGEPLGPLHGLPVAHKDSVLTAGIRTTSGSPLADHVPTENALIVERLRAAGAITIGKTNMPEFGAGSHTFNTIFGATHNPYAPGFTSGGSSGGAGAALAAGMVPIADGSDMGGSLRNPANFNNVVGLRPSVGRVPRFPVTSGWESLTVHGPMARTVEDVALMLATIAGPDPRDPLSLGTEPFERTDEPDHQRSGTGLIGLLRRDFRGTRVAFDPDLGGLPVDRRVAAVIAGAIPVLESIGAHLEPSTMDWSGASTIFHRLRAAAFLSAVPTDAESRPHLKETIRWNLELAESLTAADVADAERRRTALRLRLVEMLGHTPFVVLPVNQVPPFPIDVEYPTEIDGVAMETYIDWMSSASFVSLTGHPAISVPCGFTDDGLPVGLQIVGRHNDDLGVLQLAYAFQEATQWWRRRPPLPSS